MWPPTERAEAPDGAGEGPRGGAGEVDEGPAVGEESASM